MDATEWATTSNLLKRLGDFNDDATWQRFVDRFRPAIEAFARRTGLTGTDPEDAAQDTILAFTQAWREGRYDPSKGGLRSWLFSIAYRKVIDIMRRSDRDAVAAGQDTQTEALMSQMADEQLFRRTWDEEWSSMILETALQKVRAEVKPSTFRAFEILVLEDGTGEDASRELGMNSNAVYQAKFRVLQRLSELRRSLEKKLGESLGS